MSYLSDSDIDTFIKKCSVSRELCAVCGKEIFVILKGSKPVFFNVVDLTEHTHPKADKPTITEIRRDPGGKQG